MAWRQRRLEQLLLGDLRGTCGWLSALDLAAALPLQPRLLALQTGLGPAHRRRHADGPVTGQWHGEPVVAAGRVRVAQLSLLPWSGRGTDCRCQWLPPG